MYVDKNFSFKGIILFSGGHLIWLTLWSSIVTSIYIYFDFEWLTMPWLPLSLIGTAVAFYVGFKNNSAYDRLWEARKIWGAIVNSSRMWGSTTRSYISNQFRDEKLSDEELNSIHKKIIYRHIGWLYSLRSQLLIPTAWEHVNQGKHIRRTAIARQKRWGIGLFNDEITQTELSEFLNKDEIDRLINYQNTATQIIDQQSADLAELRSRNLIDDFRHMELQKILNDFYTYQGQCERIKKFPLPRQYGSSSFVFVGIFIFLLPLGMSAEFGRLLPDLSPWVSIPFTVLVGWVFLMMELIGDYSENPFEGLGNDIPMFALCRTIEIDLKEMLKEKDIPSPVEAKGGVLM